MDDLSCSHPLIPNYPSILHRNRNGVLYRLFISAICPEILFKAHARRELRLDQFSIQAQLYKGRYSAVYKAKCSFSGHSVAIKTYTKAKLSALNWYQLERELRIHSSLHHPHIVQLYAAFENDDHVYLIEELAENGDLYTMLKMHGKFSESHVTSVLLPPLLQTLCHLHSLGIIHRDIKPENILISSQNDILLADFGLSINSKDERPVTRAGTLDYISPEVLRCPQKQLPEENKEKILLGYGSGVDVWAVGILAAELITGTTPFASTTKQETERCITYEDVLFSSTFKVSGMAKDFIKTALIKNPRKRPTISQLLEHPWLLMGPSTSPTKLSKLHVHASETDDQQENGEEFRIAAFRSPIKNQGSNSTVLSHYYQS